MRKAFFTTILLPLAACSAASGGVAGSPAPTTLPGAVTYDVSSWGRLLTHWQINPDGSGEIWRGSGFGKGPGEVRKYKLTLGPDALRRFAAEIEPLRAATKNGTPCRMTISDMPYGAVSWDYPTGKQSWSFNTGCRSAEADAAGEQLKRAHDIVDSLATIDAQPYMTEKPS